MAKHRKDSKKTRRQPNRYRDSVKSTALSSQMGAQLADSCLRRAQSALAEGNGTTAMQWLGQVPQESIPKATLADVHYQMAKEASSHADWSFFEKELALAVKEEPVPLYQHRLALARRRQGIIDDAKWKTLCASVDPATRLSHNSLSPLVSGIWSCGAYYSRGALSARPWTILLRKAKNPSATPDEREAVISVATGFFCRFILENTPLLSVVDAIAAIPANPARYNDRRMSLPDELARAVERQLAVPFVFTALTYKAGADLELRGLSWADRYKAVKGSMDAGDLGAATGRRVLIVDDVITSGATLTEAARLLREAGVADVYALTMSHTEG